MLFSLLLGTFDIFHHKVLFKGNIERLDFRQIQPKLHQNILTRKGGHSSRLRKIFAINITDEALMSCYIINNSIPKVVILKDLSRHERKCLTFVSQKYRLKHWKEKEREMLISSSSLGRVKPVRIHCWSQYRFVRSLLLRIWKYIQIP